jgi:LCP family protein required for cell wall assembly
MKKSDKKPAPVKRKLLIALCVVLAVLLAALIVVTAYVEKVLGGINRFDGSEPTLSQEEIDNILNNGDKGTGPSMDDDDVQFGDGPAVTIGGEQIINIMLIGQDRREGQGRQRSDAMILCTVNTKAKTLTMTSFLRDLYVQIPGYQDNRLNATYQFGGMQLLNKALEVNFGVHVDGNVEVDFSSFEKVIDMVGGVDIYLTAAEAAHLNKPSRKWGLTEGVNHLQGKQALAYSRIRYIGTDFGRTNRQRTVLTALVNKAKELPYDRLMELVETAIGLVTTDMTNLEIIKTAASLIPLLKDIKIQTQYIPAEGTFQYAQIRGMSVLVPDLEANRKILVESLIP